MVLVLHLDTDTEPTLHAVRIVHIIIIGCFFKASITCKITICCNPPVHAHLQALNFELTNFADAWQAQKVRVVMA